MFDELMRAMARLSRPTEDTQDGPKGAVDNRQSTAGQSRMDSLTVNNMQLTSGQ